MSVPPITTMLANNLVIGLAIFAASIFVAWLTAVWIGRLQSAPVAELVRVTRLSHAGDYSSRAKKLSEDELGDLTDAFNEMLDEIGVREAQILKARDELEERVLERTQDLTASQHQLEIARDAAEQASRAKSEFLANVSHEIRTPLNGIIGMTELLRSADSSPEQQERLDMILESARALLYLLNDILDFSKIEARKLELEHTEFELAKVVGEAMHMLANPATEKGLELVCRIDPQLPLKLWGDPMRLRQVLTNLAGNAVKFTETGEVFIEVASAAGATSPDQVAVRFTVHDTGIGISAEAQAHIFEAFTQADSSITRKHGGTGLGLSISSQIVSIMGGTLELKSEEGVGSKFSFSVPLECRERLPLASARPGRLNTGRVLIVDDNATYRKVLCEIFASWNMLPVAVASIDAARRELESLAGTGTSLELLILDTTLPGEDSSGFLGQLQSDPAPTKPMIIAISSIISTDERKQIMKLGAHAYLGKPVLQTSLRHAIDGDLEKLARIEGKQAVWLEGDSKPPPDSVHVLVAEDGEINQKVAVGLLTKWGYSADVAPDGRAAFEAVSNGDYDVVLMDVHMPDVDGLEATSLIREQESTSDRHTPIIAMTASAMEGDRERFIAAGMDDYIAKPFEPSTLRKLIEQYAAGQRGQTAPHPETTITVDDLAIFDLDFATQRIPG